MMTPMLNLLAATHQGFFYPVQASTIARDVDPLAWFIHIITIVFTVGILAATAWFTWKYRASAHPIADPPGHSNVLEVTWTAIPAVIVFICFFWGFRVYMKMSVPMQGNVEQIEAVGQTWFWNFNYRNPNGGPDVTTSELYMPINTPIKLTLRSQDVIHALYMPVMRMKKDVVPGRFNEMYVEGTLIGDFDIYCAEYCGDGHSQMLSKLHIMSPEDYKAKIIEESDPTKKGTPEEIGLKIVKMNGCGSCHSVDGTSGTGPSWKDMFGSTNHEMADGTSVTVNDAYVLESIRNPNAKVRKGFGPPSAMNPFSERAIPDNYVKYIIAYMKSISANAPKDDTTATTRRDASTQAATNGGDLSNSSPGNSGNSH